MEILLKLLTFFLALIALKIKATEENKKGFLNKITKGGIIIISLLVISTVFEIFNVINKNNKELKEKNNQIAKQKSDSINHMNDTIRLNEILFSQKKQISLQENLQQVTNEKNIELKDKLNVIITDKERSKLLLKNNIDLIIKIPFVDTISWQNKDYFSEMFMEPCRLQILINKNNQKWFSALINIGSSVEKSNFYIYPATGTSQQFEYKINQSNGDPDIFNVDPNEFVNTLYFEIYNIPVYLNNSSEINEMTINDFNSSLNEILITKSAYFIELNNLLEFIIVLKNIDDNTIYMSGIDFKECDNSTFNRFKLLVRENQSISDSYYSKLNKDSWKKYSAGPRNGNSYYGQFY